MALVSEMVDAISSMIDCKMQSSGYAKIRIGVITEVLDNYLYNVFVDGETIYNVPCINNSTFNKNDIVRVCYPDNQTTQAVILTTPSSGGQSGSDLKIGDIISTYSNEVDENWHICDGSEVTSDNLLYNMIPYNGYVYDSISNGYPYTGRTAFSTEGKIIECNGYEFRKTTKTLIKRKVGDSQWGYSWSGLPTTYSLNDIAYGNGKYVCVGTGGKSYYSEDGQNWTAMTGITSSNAINSVCYGNGRFVCCAASGGAYYSLDGKSWISAGTGLGTVTVYDIVYVSYDNCFIGVGSSGYVVGTNSISDPTSTTPTTWGSIKQIASNQTYRGIAYNPNNNTLVVVGLSGKSYYCNYATSKTTWTAMSGLDTTSYYCVEYGQVDNIDFYVCAGASGKCYCSTNGTSWSRLLSGIGSSYTTYGIAFNNTTKSFVCVGSSGSSYEWFANHAVNWVATGENYTLQLNSICNGNNSMLAVGASGYTNIATVVEGFNYWNGIVMNTLATKYNMDFQILDIEYDETDEEYYYLVCGKMYGSSADTRDVWVYIGSKYGEPYSVYNRIITSSASLLADRAFKVNEQIFITGTSTYGYSGNAIMYYTSSLKESWTNVYSSVQNFNYPTIDFDGEKYWIGCTPNGDTANTFYVGIAYSEDLENWNIIRLTEDMEYYEYSSSHAYGYQYMGGIQSLKCLGNNKIYVTASGSYGVYTSGTRLTYSFSYVYDVDTGEKTNIVLFNNEAVVEDGNFIYASTTSGSTTTPYIYNKNIPIEKWTTVKDNEATSVVNIESALQTTNKLYSLNEYNYRLTKHLIDYDSATILKKVKVK